MVGRDNLSVNKLLEKLVDDEMKKVDRELLKIGPYVIFMWHIMLSKSMSDKKIRVHYTSHFHSNVQMHQNGMCRISAWTYGHGFGNHLLGKNIFCRSLMI